MAQMRIFLWPAIQELFAAVDIHLSVLIVRIKWSPNSTVSSGLACTSLTDLCLPTTGGTNLRYLNVSFNRFSGEIPPEFSSRIPPNATLDLSFNNLSCEIPDSSVFLNQDVKAFAGNPELCGVPLENLCHASSEPTSPPAIAAIPKTIHSNPVADSPDSGSSPASSRTRLKTGSIIAIVVGDVAAVSILALIFIYAYCAKRRKAIEGTIKKEAESAKNFDWASSSASPTEYNWLRSWTCLKTQRHADASDAASETTASESSESPKGQTPQMQAEQKTGEMKGVGGGSAVQPIISERFTLPLLSCLLRRRRRAKQSPQQMYTRCANLVEGARIEWH
nr:probable LRR receptor-like serine/threonine-protein kinase At4g37250 [Ipomoea batatas]